MPTRTGGMELARREQWGWRHPTACRAGTQETSRATADLGLDAGMARAMQTPAEEMQSPTPVSSGALLRLSEGLFPGEILQP